MTSTSSAKVMRPNHVGCTGGILRRLLCTGLRFRGLEGGGGGGGICGDVDGRGVAEEEVDDATQTPGVIARLMGLDTMPPAGEESTRNVGVRCGAGRSRSMSRIESSWAPATDEAGSARLKKSSSLRETPTFLRPENEDFLLLSFGHDDEEEEEVSATMIEICLLKLEEKEKDGRNAKKNSTKAVDRRFKKAIEKDPRTADSESSSQNSSPVSVLARDLDSNADRFIEIQEIPVSGYHSSSSTDQRRRNSQGTRCSSSSSSSTAKLDEDPSQQNSRRRRRAQELQIVVRNPITSEKVHGVAGTAATTTPAPRGTGSPELWLEIRRLTGEDVKGTNWVVLRDRTKVRFGEEVGVGVELQVFDLLLQELVDDLRPKCVCDEL